MKQPLQTDKKRACITCLLPSQRAAAKLSLDSKTYVFDFCIALIL